MPWQGFCGLFIEMSVLSLLLSIQIIPYKELLSLFAGVFIPSIIHPEWVWLLTDTLEIKSQMLH